MATFFGIIIAGIKVGLASAESSFTFIFRVEPLDGDEGPVPKLPDELFPALRSSKFLTREAIDSRPTLILAAMLARSSYN